MKIHHLNCTLPEIKGLPLNRIKREMCCHCLLIELPDTLALVDTGVSESFVQSSIRKHFFKKSTLPIRTALTEVHRLGFNPRDVQHIFLTHLDHDHVGGLSDFTWAKVYLHVNEYDFQKRLHRSPALKIRFQSQLWKGSQIQCLGDRGENWKEFESVKAPAVFNDKVLAIPLFGHSAGHSGYAIEQNGKWLLHAGDAFYFKDDLARNPNDRSIFSETLAMALSVDDHKRIENLEKLRVLNENHKECVIVNSHDPIFLNSVKL